ncbi:MAG: hypothetical protein AAGD11_16110 [Planctomycetota bacterium]
MRKRKSRALFFLVVLLGLFEGHAYANLVTFSFSAADAGQSTLVKSVDGLTMTLSNPMPGNFDADSDGLVVFATSGFTLDAISSFEIEFSMPVSLVSYRVGFTGNLELAETITLSAGSATSVESEFDETGTADLFMNQFSVAAGQRILVTGNDGGTGTDLVQWDQITVQAIPEPSAFLLLAMIVVPFGIVSIMKRR